MRSGGEPLLPEPARPRPRASRRVLALVALALAVPAGFLIFTGNNIGRAALDATAYHIRFIRDLARDYPDFDLSNPLTATTPGYHILLASLAQVLGDSTTVLRCASALIGVAFVSLVAAWCSRRAAPTTAALLALPLAASLYVMGSAAWTAPDNLAWLLVASICFLCVRAPLRGRDLAIACVLLVPLVAVRQIHIWCAAVVWAAAWSDARARGAAVVPSLRATAPWVLATAPGWAVLGYFALKWGGLAPPRFQGEVDGISLATPAFILLQISVLAVGFSPWIVGPLATAWRLHRPKLLCAAAAGLLLAVVPDTTASFEAGRFGGWWGVVERLPVIGGRTSLAMLAGAAVGAVATCALLIGLDPRRRPVLGIALLAFTVALTANHYCWQRYHEPFLLVLLPALALLQQDPKRTLRGAEHLPPAALIALLAGITAAGVLRGERVPDDAIPAAGHIAPGDRFDSK